MEKVSYMICRRRLESLASAGVAIVLYLTIDSAAFTNIKHRHKPECDISSNTFHKKKLLREKSECTYCKSLLEKSLADHMVNFQDRLSLYEGENYNKRLIQNYVCF